MSNFPQNLRFLNCIFISMIFAIVPTSQSYAQTTTEPDPSTYLFYPESPLHLGGGLSPNNLAQPKADCLTYDTYLIDGDSSLKTTFSKILVRNSEQLKSALSLDAKIDASYLTFSGNSSFSYDTSSMFSGDSLTVVLTAKTEYGRKGVRNVTLNDIGKRWISNGRKFAEICGTRFVNVQHNASVTSIIITISGLSESDKSGITLNLSAQGGWGPLSAGASTKFDKQLASATGQDQIDIQVVSTGGAGLSSLGDLLKSLDQKGSLVSIDAVENAMGDYLKSFTSSNAAPVAFDVTPMTFIGWDPNSVSLWTDYQQQILDQLVHSYRDINAEKNSVEALLNGTDARNLTLTSDQRNTLSTLDHDYSSYMQLLATAHDKCQATEPPSCNIPPRPANWPTNPISDLPNPPTGYFSIVAFGEPSTDSNPFPPLDIWSISRSRAFIAGLNPLSKGTILTSNSKDLFLDPNEKFFSTAGHTSALLYFIKGGALEDTIQFVYKEDGSDFYASVGTVQNTCNTSSNFPAKQLNGLQNIPSDVVSCVYMGGAGMASFSPAGLQNPIFALAFQYVILQAQPSLPTCTEKSTHAGTFALHLFDDYGRDFYLPILRANWQLDHYWPTHGVGCMYGWDDTAEIDIIE
jgi:hypothetical protein